MSNSIRKTAIALLALFAAAMLALALVFLPATASAATSTAEQENTYDSGTLRRAVKVENDSFTITCKIVANGNPTHFGIAFFNSPETNLSIGNSGVTNQGLVLLVNLENFNLYNSNGWTESTQTFNGNAGWMVNAYKVNDTKVTITLSKGENDAIVISTLSTSLTDGTEVNTNFKEGVTLQPELFNKSGTARPLYFSDLVDENGYTYLNVDVTNDFNYAYTAYDEVTTVSDVTFTYDDGSAADAGSLSIVGALGADDQERYIAEATVTENGYSFIGPDVEKLIFSDGNVQATAAVGENVVLPSGYETGSAPVIVGQSATGTANDRWSIGDSSYGMVSVYDDAVSFDIGIKYDSAPAGNVNFNICIGPNTFVQSPGQNIPATNPAFGPGIFSLFMTVTPENQLCYSFYDMTWAQFTPDNEFKTLTVGEWNHVTLEIKKVDGVWGVYFDGTQISGSNAGGTLDFNAQYGDTFMNAAGKTNIAFTGQNWGEGTVALFGEKVSVSSEISSSYAADTFAVSVAGAEDAQGNPVDVFDGTASAAGFSFVTFAPERIKTVQLATYGGVVTDVQADYSEGTYAPSVTLGSEDTQYDRTITVKDSGGQPVEDATVRVMDGEADVSAYYEIEALGGGVYVIHGVNRAINVEVSATLSGGNASESIFFAQSETSKEVTLSAFPYTYTSAVLQNLTYGGNKIFTSGAVSASSGLSFTVDLQNPTQAAGFQLYFTNARLSADRFVDPGTQAEYFDCDGIDGVRLVVLMSDGMLYLDIIPMQDGEGTNLGSGDCAYVGDAGKTALGLTAAGRHTFMLSGSTLYLDNKEIYDFGTPLWQAEDGSTYVSLFVSRGYMPGNPSDNLGVAVYADQIEITDATVTGIDAADVGGMRFVGFDEDGLEYAISAAAFDFENNSYTVTGLNIGNRIVGVRAYTAGGVSAQFTLTPGESVAFGAGYTAVLTPNVPVAKEGIVVLDADGQDITAYLDITVGTDNKITIAGLQNVDLTVKLSAENYDTLSVDVAVAEQNVEQNVTLQHSVYSVTVELLMDGAALEGMADAITVYAADDTSLTTPLDVEISFADGKYTVSGILGGTDVLVVFEAEGYVSERLNATPEQPNVTFNVRRVYDATFTVKAGDAFLTDESAITVAGANEGAQLAYDEDLQKFVITALTNEIRITVKVAGYAEATQIFSADATTADIVLTAFDFSDLNAAIASAEQALAGASVSADGSDVATDVKWTTQAAADTFKAAIEAAKAALTGADTQEEVASAVDTLEAAQSAFTASLKAGTMQEQGPSDGGETEGCGGCGSSAFAGWAGLSLGLIAAACVLLCLRKKSR